MPSRVELRRPARLPVQPAATAQAFAYRAALAPLMAELGRLVDGLAAEVAPRLRPEARTDSVDELIRRALQSFRGAAQRWLARLLKSLGSTLPNRVEGIERVARLALKGQLDAVVRVNPQLPKDAAATLIDRAGDPKLVAREEWVRENVALVRRLGGDAATEITNLVTTAAQKGTRVEVLARQLQERVGVSRRRADLIARDQTTKLSSQFHEAQQRALGVTRYTWRHSHVTVGARQAHVERDGKVFRWDQPPADGHPGAAPNCRCTAEPVIDALPVV